MIYTEMKYLHHYLGIHENLDTAIRFLTDHGPEQMKPGRNEVDGDRVYINRFGYESIPEEQAVFEAHEHYADIHLVISGREQIGVSNLENMEILGIDQETDSVDCGGPVENRLVMTPGRVLILMPEDAHKVKIADGESVRVEKAVVKVRVRE